MLSRVDTQNSSTPDGRGDAVSDTAEQLLEVSAGLFSSHGFEATSTRAIADAAGRTQSVIFHYFRSKIDILSAVAERAMAELVATLDEVDADADPPARLAALVHRHALLVLGPSPYLRAVLLDQNAGFREQFESWDALTRRYEEGFMDVVVAGQRSGDFVPGEPEFAYLAICGILHAAPKWFRPGPIARRLPVASGLSLDAAADELTRWSMRVVLRRPEEIDGLLAAIDRGSEQGCAT